MFVCISVVAEDVRTIRTATKLCENTSMVVILHLEDRLSISLLDVLKLFFMRLLTLFHF